MKFREKREPLPKLGAWFKYRDYVLNTEIMAWEAPLQSALASMSWFRVC